MHKKFILGLLPILFTLSSFEHQAYAAPWTPEFALGAPLPFKTSILLNQYTLQLGYGYLPINSTVESLEFIQVAGGIRFKPLSNNQYFGFTVGYQSFAMAASLATVTVYDQPLADRIIFGLNKFYIEPNIGFDWYHGTNITLGSALEIQFTLYGKTNLTTETNDKERVIPNSKYLNRLAYLPLPQFDFITLKYFF